MPMPFLCHYVKCRKITITVRMWTVASSIACVCRLNSYATSALYNMPLYCSHIGPIFTAEFVKRYHVNIAYCWPIKILKLVSLWPLKQIWQTSTNVFIKTKTSANVYEKVTVFKVGLHVQFFVQESRTITGRTTQCHYKLESFAYGAYSCHNILFMVGSKNTCILKQSFQGHSRSLISVWIERASVNESVIVTLVLISDIAGFLLRNWPQTLNLYTTRILNVFPLDGLDQIVDVGASPSQNLKLIRCEIISEVQYSNLCVHSTSTSQTDLFWHACLIWLMWIWVTPQDNLI